MARRSKSREAASLPNKESRAVARATVRAPSGSDRRPGSLFADGAHPPAQEMRDPPLEAAEGGESPPASATPRGRGRVSNREASDGTPVPPTVEAAASPSPLEVMLDAMHEHWRARRLDDAARLARDAAPYLHPRPGRAAPQGDSALRHEDALAELD